jgi:DNA polymerase
MHGSRLAAQQRAMDRAFGVDLLDHARLVQSSTTPVREEPTDPHAHEAAAASAGFSAATRPLSPRPVAILGGTEVAGQVPAPRPLAPFGSGPRAAAGAPSAAHSGALLPGSGGAGAASTARSPAAASSEVIGIGGSGARLNLEGERHALLEALRERHARECPHCTRATGHTNLVFGEGSPNAQLVFVGEAPGETEDQTGRPFVGKAGQKLDEMIAAMKLRREDVYIANVLKSRPPSNRTPLQAEVDLCGPYLIEQLCIIRPRVIVTLGGPAAKLLLATEVGITRLRGAWGAWKAPTWTGVDLSVPVMPTYHPAYLLRNYTAQTRGEVWADLQAVMTRIGS